MLHARDRERLSQRLVNARTGHEVPTEQVRKGYPVDRGVYVSVDHDELANCEPEPSRDIEISAFVPPEAIPPQYYERPYYLGPDTGHEADYQALATALENPARHGIARWTMRKQNYVGALMGTGGIIMLITMRRPDELVPGHELSPPEGRDLTAQEKQLSQQLLDALTGDFDPEQYHDEYQTQLHALVEAKQKGKHFKAPVYKPKKQEASLVDSLRQSVNRVRSR